MRPTLGTKILELILGTLFFALCARAEAQQAKKLHRIGFLGSGTVSSMASRVQSFQQGLRELDYIEGKNILIKYRFAEGNDTRFPELATELVRLKPDVSGSPGIRALGVRPDDSKTTFKSFKQELQKLGYVDGKNIVYEYRNAENKAKRLPALVHELIGLKVDVLVVAAINEARAAKNATKTIPIVGLNLADPVQSGLIESLARPGANLTGITPISGELGGKRLELLQETVAKLSRVAVLWDPKAPSSKQTSEELQLPASALGLQLHSMEVTNPSKLADAFKEAIKAHSSALAVNLSAMLNANQRRVHDLAAKYRLPAIYGRAEFVRSGGLMSYGADREAGFARAAAMVDKILNGAKPADIPVERPTKFELVINLKAAKQSGLTIPPNVLARADKVIR